MEKKPVIIETLVSNRGTVLKGHHVEVLPGKWIRLFGECDKYAYLDGELITVRLPYSRTFNIGDLAEYDSYNLSYYGKIVSIGAKTVTIVDGPYRRRLTFEEFTDRNHDFDLLKVERENAREMECI